MPPTLCASFETSWKSKDSKNRLYAACCSMKICFTSGRYCTLACMVPDYGS